MKFDLDGLEVFFPYERMYPEQKEYMTELKKALDAKGHCMLEMPTGTGKTVSLLSLITSYQRQNPNVGSLIYCTRTVPEMSQTIEELKKVVEYTNSAVEGENSLLGVCLSSRRNMCVHDEVIEQSNREAVDSLCRKMTAPWVRNQYKKENDIEDAYKANKLCKFYENYSDLGTSDLQSGIFNLEDMREYGKKHNICPYFLTRSLIKSANVIVFNYQYMLDPKVASLVSKELSSNSIVVFDEAHNIDNVCIEALSVNFNRRSLQAADKNLNKLTELLDETKKTDQNKLVEEYNKLVQGLTGEESANIDELDLRVVDKEILNEAVPGSIRKGEHFLQALRLILKHLKTRLEVERVEKETPAAFLHELHKALAIESRPLRFTYTRLNSLLKTLEVVELDEFEPITQVADFLSLVATPAFKDGFMLILEPFDERTPHFIDPILQFACLDASIAIKPVLTRFQSVVITSGTLSPIDLYPTLLNLRAKVKKSLSMSIVRKSICPVIVTKGSDQSVITSQFSARNDPSVASNYGSLLLQLAQNVPDGIVCFFPSYQYMENIVTEWEKSGILQKILRHKLVFLETKDVVETTIALDNYRKACDCGRGALFISIARGKVSEGIDFDRHYGRAVVLCGIPFQYTRSHILLARLEYLRKTFEIREDEFLAFDALRQSAQCVGRVIRNKLDYGIMIFADKRYASNSKKSKLPKWILQFMEDAHTNLSVDEAITVCKGFLRDIGSS